MVNRVVVANAFLGEINEAKKFSICRSYKVAQKTQS